jgi:hypothetical protein
MSDPYVSRFGSLATFICVVSLLVSGQTQSDGGYKVWVKITRTQATKYASLQIEARSDEGLLFTYVCNIGNDLCHAPVVGRNYRMVPSVFKQYKCDNYELMGPSETPLDVCLSSVRKESD